MAAEGEVLQRTLEQQTPESMQEYIRSVVRMCDTWPLQRVFIDHLAQVVEQRVDPFFPARPLTWPVCAGPLCRSASSGVVGYSFRYSRAGSRHGDDCERQVCGACLDASCGAARPLKDGMGFKGPQ